ALVCAGRAPHTGLPPILLHSRTLSAVRDAGRAALGPDLLLHPRLFRWLPPRAPLLLRDIEAHARLAALERRGSGRVLLPALVRPHGRARLAENPAGDGPPRLLRRRGRRRAGNRRDRRRLPDLHPGPPLGPEVPRPRRGLHRRARASVRAGPEGPRVPLLDP